MLKIMLKEMKLLEKNVINNFSIISFHKDITKVMKNIEDYINNGTTLDTISINTTIMNIQQLHNALGSALISISKFYANLIMIEEYNNKSTVSASAPSIKFTVKTVFKDNNSNNIRNCQTLCSFNIKKLCQLYSNPENQCRRRT